MEVTTQLGVGRELRHTGGYGTPSAASLDMSVTSSSNWKKLIVETISNNYDLQKDFILNHYDVYLKLIGYYMSIILQKKR